MATLHYTAPAAQPSSFVHAAVLPAAGAVVIADAADGSLLTFALETGCLGCRRALAPAPAGMWPWSTGSAWLVLQAHDGGLRVLDAALADVAVVSLDDTCVHAPPQDTAGVRWDAARVASARPPRGRLQFSPSRHHHSGLTSGVLSGQFSGPYSDIADYDDLASTDSDRPETAGDAADDSPDAPLSYFQAFQQRPSAPARVTAWLPLCSVTALAGLDDGRVLHIAVPDTSELPDRGGRATMLAPPGWLSSVRCLHRLPDADGAACVWAVGEAGDHAALAVATAPPPAQYPVTVRASAVADGLPTGCRIAHTPTPTWDPVLYGPSGVLRVAELRWDGAVGGAVSLSVEATGITGASAADTAVLLHDQGVCAAGGGRLFYADCLLKRAAVLDPFALTADGIRADPEADSVVAARDLDDGDDEMPALAGHGTDAATALTAAFGPDGRLWVASLPADGGPSLSVAALEAAASGPPRPVSEGAVVQSDPKAGNRAATPAVGLPSSGLGATAPPPESVASSEAVAGGDLCRAMMGLASAEGRRATGLGTVVAAFEESSARGPSPDPEALAPGDDTVLLFGPGGGRSAVTDTLRACAQDAVTTAGAPEAVLSPRARSETSSLWGAQEPQFPGTCPRRCVATIPTSTADLAAHRDEMDIFVLARMVGDQHPVEATVPVGPNATTQEVQRVLERAFERRLTVAFTTAHGRMSELRRATVDEWRALPDARRGLICRPLFPLIAQPAINDAITHGAFPAAPAPRPGGGLGSVSRRSATPHGDTASDTSQPPRAQSATLSKDDQSAMVKRLYNDSVSRRTRDLKRLEANFYPTARPQVVSAGAAANIVRRLASDPGRRRNAEVERVRKSYVAEGKVVPEPTKEAKQAALKLRLQEDAPDPDDHDAVAQHEHARHRVEMVAGDGGPFRPLRVRKCADLEEEEGLVRKFYNERLVRVARSQEALEAKLRFQPRRFRKLGGEEDLKAWHAHMARPTKQKFKYFDPPPKDIAHLEP